jgi:integrase
MTNHDTTSPLPQSEKEVRKSPIGQASKFSPQFWAGRIFRPAYTTADGERREVAEWHMQLQHAGRREKIGLGSNQRDPASRVAASVFAAVRSKGWAAGLAAVLPGRSRPAGVPTIGELIAAATKAADVSSRSAKNYATCLRVIAAEAFGIHGDRSKYDYVKGGTAAYHERIDRIRLDKLTPARVQAALNARIAATRGNPLTEQRARMTAATTLRQAKCLFSPRLRLPFENLPNPFDGVRVKVGTPRKYASTIDAGTLLRAGQAELAESDPEAYKALLLALGAGLRKGEIDCLQWQQLDVAAGIIRIQTTSTFHAKTDSSEGDVFIDAGLAAALDAYRSKATSLYVLESHLPPKPSAGFKYYRARLTFKRLAAWLRSKGVLANKPLHEMRKEFGSIVAAAGGIHVASRQLRHASIATTAAFYADHRTRIAPAVGAMLAGQPETNSAGKANVAT